MRLLTNILKVITSMATIFSFFSGSGFLDLGFEKSGFRVDFVNEFHPPFLEAYKYSRKIMDMPEPKCGYYLNSIEEFVNGGSKSAILEDSVRKCQSQGELVGFIGGPPCPDFSVGGKNRGQEGENGKLTRTYVESIIEHKPDFFLFENVKGLWRTARHRAFYEEMKSLLREHGYVLSDHLINSIRYGAAQDRDRILLFGIKIEHVKHMLSDVEYEHLVINDKLFNWEARTTYTLEQSLKLGSWPDTEAFSEGSLTVMPSNVVKELTIEYWFQKNNVTKHPNATHFFQPKSPKFKEIDEGDVGKKSFKRLHRWRYSPTAAYGNNEVHLHPYKARRLSAAEALAIQSLPIEFALPPTMTLSNMFKTIGNGVPYVAAFGIAMTIRDFLDRIR